MLGFVTIVSLKAMIYVASLGIFVGNLWLFKDNVHTFTHLLSASRNHRSASSFDSPPSVTTTAGPIMLPSLLPTSIPIDADRDLIENKHDDKEWYDGLPDEMQYQILSEEESPRSAVSRPMMQLLPAILLMFTTVAITIIKWFKHKVSTETSQRTGIISDDTQITPTTTGSLSLDVKDINFICSEIIQSILRDAMESSEEEHSHQFTKQIANIESSEEQHSHQFANQIANIDDECDRHHQEHNHPGWACHHCRIAEQTRIDNESLVQDLRTQLAFSETQLKNHQVFIDKFDTALQDVLDHNQKLIAENALLKIDVFQKEGRIKTTETLVNDVERMHAEASEKLDTLREHHDYVVERNRQLTAQNDELNIRVSNLRLDCLTLSKSNETLKNRIVSFQCEFERQLIDCKERMEFQLLEFSK